MDTDNKLKVLLSCFLGFISRLKPIRSTLVLLQLLTELTSIIKLSVSVQILDLPRQRFILIPTADWVEDNSNPRLGTQWNQADSVPTLIYRYPYKSLTDCAYSVSQDYLPYFSALYSLRYLCKNLSYTTPLI